METVYIPHGGGPLLLHVCCALAGEAGKLIFDGMVTGKRAVGLHWRI